ncbi:LysE/ArgO family amino acid transporter [Lentilitoribacter sp. Alg239-R112]|uniref:LysE/ArgO family amino acid transporter n=1 Tax=Lentilitoribacter sp. Alg239-R112 TaxID=2305987 RepID=UPI0013A6F2D2|nr:LysE/ArgO family amino acid transporter [Lentilitoribacter sp. Alg239-R112]
MTIYLSPFVSGFILGASLIIAIGAQNAFVLRQGLLQKNVFVICLICAASDALLISMGVTGLGLLIERLPGLITIITLAGATFLFVYGMMAVKRVFLPQSMESLKENGLSLRAAVLTCLAFTFLNPHVYLDTFILIGGLSASYDGGLKIAFTVGAMMASFGWFFSLGYGARLLVPFFEKPNSWRVLDGLIAIVMFGLAISLLLQFLNG